MLRVSIADFWRSREKTPCRQVLIAVSVKLAFTVVVGYVRLQVLRLKVMDLQKKAILLVFFFNQIVIL